MSPANPANNPAGSWPDCSGRILGSSQSPIFFFFFPFPLPIRPYIRPETGRILGRIPGSGFPKFPAFIFKTGDCTHTPNNESKTWWTIHTCHLYIRKCPYTIQTQTLEFKYIEVSNVRGAFKTNYVTSSTHLKLWFNIAPVRKTKQRGWAYAREVPNAQFHDTTINTYT